MVYIKLLANLFIDLYSVLGAGSLVNLIISRPITGDQLPYQVYGPQPLGHARATSSECNRPNSSLFRGVCLHTSSCTLWVPPYIRPTHTYINTYIGTYIHTYIHTYIRTDVRTHTYIHTYIICIHNYKSIHTWFYAYINLCVLLV